MKTFPFLNNWRAMLLIALGFIAFICLIGESDDICVLLSVKALAILLTVVVTLLGKRWSRQGKLDDMNDLLSHN